MSYIDGKGYYRSDGEGGFDIDGIYRSLDEGYIEHEINYRSFGEEGYDSDGYYIESGTDGYDHEEIYRLEQWGVNSQSNEKPDK